MAVTPPEHRARTRRWGREKKRRGRRRTGEEAARDGRRESAAGFDDAEKVVVPESSSPVKKLRRLPSQIGEVFGSLCRVESIDIEDENEVPDFAVAAPTPSPTLAAAPDGNPDKGVVLAHEAAAPAQGGAGTGVTAPSSSKPAAASTVTGRVAPEPEPVVDQKTLRRLAAIAAERKRFVVGLRRTEMKAKLEGFFMQSARREHLRALGIDTAMERVVSPERLRDGDGEPIVSPEHPCSPVENLGLFLKPL